MVTTCILIIFLPSKISLYIPYTKQKQTTKTKTGKCYNNHKNCYQPEIVLYWFRILLDFMQAICEVAFNLQNKFGRKGVATHIILCCSES